MSDDQPTRRLQRVRPDQPTTPMPGPLDLTGREASQADAETDVLRLDELFDGERPAMPVVPVRSERADAPLPSRPATTRQRSEVAARIRADAAGAWRAGSDRTRAWLRVQDNAIMVLTAVIGIILIVVVAALGH